MVWYFIGVYIINKTLHGRLEIQNFSSRVEKNIFQHSKINFVSLFGRVKSSISYLIGQYLILRELKYPQIKILVKFKHR